MMGQVSAYLRRATNAYGHWCPGCGEMHLIPDTWSFNGNVHVPSFGPSVKITGKQIVKVNGQWTGEWVRDAAGNTVDSCCHYILTSGQLQFCGDCTHALSGQNVPLPPLPDGFTDG
jgi:hypothetical protein